MTVIAPTVTCTTQGVPIEVCEGANEHHLELSGAGNLSRGRRLVRHHHQTLKRAVERAEAGGPPQREPRPHNFDAVRDVVAERVAKSRGRISAKRLLPIARAAGYAGSPRNFRRLVAAEKALWRNDNRGRRPGCGRRVSIW